MVRTVVQERFAEVFEPQQARVLAEVMVEAYDDLVKAGDFNELKGIVRELATAQKELAKQVQELVMWQRGEAGRREGERYEQFLAKRAFALFNGGHGGTPDQPVMQQWLREQLRHIGSFTGECQSDGLPDPPPTSRYNRISSLEFHATPSPVFLLPAVN